jgi:hypothetical protein
MGLTPLKERYKEITLDTISEEKGNQYTDIQNDWTDMEL